MFGPLTSATVSGKLLRLDASQQRHAWGIAASQAGGITGNFGTHTKPLHGGIAEIGDWVIAEVASIIGAWHREGIARRTSNWPRSWVIGVIVCSIMMIRRAPGSGGRCLAG